MGEMHRARKTVLFFPFQKTIACVKYQMAANRKQQAAQRSRHCGFLFSRKARIPSRASSARAFMAIASFAYP